MPDKATLLRVAPLVFVLLWSTGFIAAKYSMQNADPFVFLCLRFSITALVLIPILLMLGAALPRRIWTFRHDMDTGALLHCGYLGFLFWPIKNGGDVFDQLVRLLKTSRDSFQEQQHSFYRVRY